jgi:hypothetical protein
MEAIFQAECLRFFSRGFQPTFCSLSEVTGDISPGTAISGVFLPNPVTFPHLFGKIHLFPEAGIIDLSIMISMHLILFFSRLNEIPIEMKLKH